MRLKRFTLYYTYFTDLLGYAVALPVLIPALFEMEVPQRLFLYGALLFVYSLGQILGKVLFTPLASRIGAKPTLCFSLLLNSFAYLLCGLALFHHNLFFLFVGRILGGLTTANSAQVFILLEDFSPPRKTLLLTTSIAASIGLVMGPLLSGLAGDDLVHPMLSAAIPFGLSALLILCNLGLVLLLAPHIKNTALAPSIFSFPRIRMAAFTGIFLFCTAWIVFIQYIPFFLWQRFNFQESDIGLCLAVLGLFWSAHIPLERSKFLDLSEAKKKRVLYFLMLGGGVCMVAASQSQTALEFLLLGGWPAFCAAMIWPRLNLLLGHNYYSIMAISALCAPLLGSVLAEINAQLPLLASGGAMLLAGVLLTSQRARKPSL